MPKTETGMRQRIAEFLPGALEKAIISYENFMEQSHDDEGKFKSHHDACKVALAHIELLVKLAKWADLPDPALEGEDQNRVLQGLIERAQEEISGDTDG
jgi:hypothetical protein